MKFELDENCGLLKSIGYLFIKRVGYRPDV
jgi:hypothetical protein